MAGSVDTCSKVGTASFEYGWSGCSPYNVYMHGDVFLAETTETTQIVYSDDAYEPPIIEVLDATEDASCAWSVKNSSIFQVHWRGNADMAYYVVEQYSASVWTPKRIMQELGEGYYTAGTQALADATTHTWQVLQVDSEGNESPNAGMAALMVCNPDAPSVSLSYASSTGNVTVAAR